jgi:hypothetical protein
MSTGTLAPAVTTGPNRTHTLRLLLAAAAIVVLLAVSFLIGRATASTRAHAPADVPATTVPAVHGSHAPHPQPGTDAFCQVHHPC